MQLIITPPKPHIEAYLKRFVLDELLSESELDHEEVWDSTMQAAGATLDDPIQMYFDQVLPKDVTIHNANEWCTVADFQELMQERMAVKRSEMKYLLSFIKTGLLDKSINEPKIDFSAVDMFAILERGLTIAIETPQASNFSR